MKIAALLAISLLRPLAAADDDLPPGVLLLSRIKRHLRSEFTRLPDYTCLETAERQLKPAGARSTLRRVDVVRLEVLNTGTNELYAAPGSSDFREDSPSAFSTTGLVASGLFASFLQTLFVQDNGIFTWRGKDEAESRRMFTGLGDSRSVVSYDFVVPLLNSGWNLQVTAGRGDVAMKGTIWVDAKTLDLVRLRVQADDIPYHLRVADASIRLEYARTRIGEIDALLPQSGEVSMLHNSGEMSRNLLDYTHCRAFQAQSTLSFALSTVSYDVPPGWKLASNIPDGILPAGLPVSLRLDTAISEKQTVGAQLSATLTADIREKNKVLVPAGAIVTGRLRRLDHGEPADSFTVGLEFTAIQDGQQSLRFYADLESVSSNGGVEMIRDSAGTSNLPGVALLFVRGSRLALQPGLKLAWKTRSLAR